MSSNLSIIERWCARRYIRGRFLKSFLYFMLLAFLSIRASGAELAPFADGQVAVTLPGNVTSETTAITGAVVSATDDGAGSLAEAGTGQADIVSGPPKTAEAEKVVPSVSGTVDAGVAKTEVISTGVQNTTLATPSKEDNGKVENTTASGPSAVTASMIAPIQEPTALEVQEAQLEAREKQHEEAEAARVIAAGYYKDVPVPPSPPERQFVIPGDNCGEYLIPWGQKNALIYETKLTYTTNNDTTIPAANTAPQFPIPGSITATWQYLDSLKLPIHCLWCKDSVEYAKTNKLTPQIQEDLSMNRITYMGADFLKGSRVCINVEVADGSVPDRATDREPGQSSLGASATGPKTTAVKLSLSPFIENLIQNDVLALRLFALQSTAAISNNTTSQTSFKQLFGNQKQTSKTSQVSPASSPATTPVAGDGSGSFQAIFPSSILTSTIDMQAQISADSSGPAFKNMYSIKQAFADKLPTAGATIFSQYSDFSVTDLQKKSWEYPYFQNVYIALAIRQEHQSGHISLQLEETCSTLDANTLRKAEATGQSTMTESDWAAAITIYNKGFGCFSCKQRDEKDPERNSYAFITSLGFDGVPSALQLKQPGIYLERHCAERHTASIDFSKDNVMGQRYYHQRLRPAHSGHVVEQACGISVRNCAVCGGPASSECKVCLDGHALHVVQYEDKKVEQCIYDFCPAQHRIVKNWNGLTFCEPCTITNCNECVITRVNITASTLGQSQLSGQSGELKDLEVCMQCQGSYVLSAAKDACISVIQYLSEKSAKVPSVSITRNYILEPRATPIYPQNLTLSELQQIEADETDEKFEFIQQALHDMNQIAPNYIKVDATIWLTKGDHFFFYCDELIDFKNDDEPDQVEAPTPLKSDILCTLKSLKAQYPKTDNINLVLRALDCDAVQAQKLDKAIIDPAWFRRVCVKLDNQEKEDERPVIYVNSPDFYFNITKQAIFRDVIFDGINAFAEIHQQTLNQKDKLVEESQRVPQWPQKICQLQKLNGTAVDRQSSPLIQLTQEINFGNSSNAFGYGHLPMDNLIEGNSSLLFDRSRRKSFGTYCIYQNTKAQNGGQQQPKQNLYDNGTVDELLALQAGMYPQLLPQQVERAKKNMSKQRKEDPIQPRRHQRAYSQDELRYNSTQFNHFTVDKNNRSDSYGEAYAFGRRKTLFNLYGFMFTDSSQKNISKQFNDVDLNMNYQIPTLKLQNVEVRNFLYDYQSLIHIEKDNFIARSGVAGPGKDKDVIYHFGDNNVEANIHIHSSKVIDSSFDLGMIYVPPPQKFIDLDHQILYQFNLNQDPKYIDIIDNMYKLSQGQKQIIVTNSIFVNLNYGKAVHSLSSLRLNENRFSESKGILCSIAHFSGRVEFINNTISKNMVFIPTAIFSNSQKYNKTVVGPKLQEFKSEADPLLGYAEHAYLNLRINETRQLHHEIHFMNYMDMDLQQAILRDNYTTQSTIYIKKVMNQHVVLENNTFDSNIGIHGGAIHIDLSDFHHVVPRVSERYSPSIVIQNNTFMRNQAYFDGNAIYIKGAQKYYNDEAIIDNESLMHVAITKCKFIKNYGVNVAIGSAISIDGRQDAQYLKSLEAKEEEKKARIEAESKSAANNITRTSKSWTNGMNEEGLEQAPAEQGAQAKDLIGSREIPEQLTDQYDQQDEKHASFNGTLDYGARTEYTAQTRPGHISILDCEFTQNYAGQRASAINLENIQTSNISIINSLFYNNTDSYSIFEVEHSLPFFDILTMRQHRLNFIVHDNQDICKDEIVSVGEPRCLYQHYNSFEDASLNANNKLKFHDLHFQYPQMKGTIYLVGNRMSQIQNCTFSKNDAGPLFNSLQVVGMINNDNPYGNVQRASTIYVDRGTNIVEISDSHFHDNHLDFMKPYIKENNIDLYRYFPEDNFNSSHAPQINVHMNEYNQSPCHISISNNLFHDQRNIGILGYSQFNESYVDMTYWGQLLAVRSLSANSLVEFSNNTVYNYIFQDSQSSLIHKSFLGQLRIQDNNIFNVGMLATKDDKIFIPVLQPPPAKKFDYTQENTFKRQKVGIVQFEGNRLQSPGQYHLIKNNRFRKIYAFASAIANIEEERGGGGDLQDIRYHFQGNFYFEVFGSEAAILRVSNENMKKLGTEQRDYLENNNQQVGIVVLEDELVSQSQSTLPESSLIRVETKSKLLTIIIKNSIFTENYLGVLKAVQCTVYMHGCIVSNNRFEAKMGHNFTGPHETNRLKQLNTQRRLENIQYWSDYKNMSNRQEPVPQATAPPQAGPASQIAISQNSTSVPKQKSVIPNAKSGSETAQDAVGGDPAAPPTNTAPENSIGYIGKNQHVHESDQAEASIDQETDFLCLRSNKTYFDVETINRCQHVVDIDLIISESYHTYIAGIPASIRNTSIYDRMLEDYKLTQTTHQASPNSSQNLKPTAAQMHQGSIPNPIFSVIDLTDSKNNWGTLPSDSKFFTNIQFREQIGIQSIFSDFSLESGLENNQIQASIFYNLPRSMHAQTMISLQKNSVIMTDIRVKSVQFVVIKTSLNSDLEIHRSSIQEIGTQILHHREDVEEKKYLKALEPYLVSRDDPGFDQHPEGGQNGFLMVQRGNLKIHNCRFMNSLSSKGLIQATDNMNIVIKNSTFQRIIGVEQSALIFAIQNEKGTIMVRDTKIYDTVSQISMISLTFATIELQNIVAEGNFAFLNSHAVSMIQAEAVITDSYFSNHRNEIGISRKQMDEVQAGVINMNYQSRIRISNTLVQGFRTQQASFIFSTGQSSIQISNVSLYNMTSSGHAIIAQAPTEFLFTQSTLRLSNGISIANLLPTNFFTISKSLLYPSMKQNINGSPMIDITQSPGHIHSCDFRRGTEFNNTDAKYRAITIVGPQSRVRISESNFINLHQEDEAGALLIRDGGDNHLANNVFKGNHANQGGAIVIRDTRSTVFENCTFENNAAINTRAEREINLIRDQNIFRGGALYIDNVRGLHAGDVATKIGGLNQQYYLPPARQVLFLVDNVFKANHADIQGGAISYRSQGIEEETPKGEKGATIYVGNTAGIHSDTIASYTSRLQIVYDERVSTLLELEELKNDTLRASLHMKSSAQKQLTLLQAAAGRSRGEGFISELANSKIVEVPSGQYINLTVRLLDERGRIVKSENSATAQIRMDTVESYLAQLQLREDEWSKANADNKKTGLHTMQQEGVEDDTEKQAILKNDREQDEVDVPENEAIIDLSYNITSGRSGRGLRASEQEDRMRRELQSKLSAVSIPEAAHAARMGSLSNSQAQCVNGTFKFPDLVVVQEPGTLVVIQVIISGLAENGIEKTFVKTPEVQIIYSRRCISGEEQTEDTCKPCGYGFYLIHPPMNGESESCLPCNVNAMCSGRNSLAPKPNYFRLNDTTSEILPCYQDDVCLGGTSDDMLGQCAKGYLGMMCASCATNYYKKTWIECAECGAYHNTCLWALARLCWFTIFILGTMNIVQSIAVVKDDQKQAIIGQIKLMVNHCVILNAVDSIKYDWTPMVKYTLYWQTRVARMVAKNLSFSCLLLGAGKSHDPAFQTFFKELLLAVLFPLVLIVWLSFLINILGSMKGLGAKEKQDQLICSIVIVIWMFQPDIASYIFASFSCVERGGKQRLFQDLEIICWEGQHLNFIYFVSIPALLLWIILPPCIFYKKLKYDSKYAELLKTYFKNKQRRDELFSHPNDNNKEQVQRPEIRITLRKYKQNMKEKIVIIKIDKYTKKYGFLFLGFKEEVYYWELVVITRKLIIIFAVQFLSSVSPFVQVLVGILIIIASIMSIIGIKPFANNEVNFNNIYSQAIQMLMMYVGLFYMTGSGKSYMQPGSIINWILMPINVFPSVIFFYRWAKKMFTIILCLVYVRNREMFVLITCGILAPNDFYREHIEVKPNNGKGDSSSGESDQDDRIVEVDVNSSTSKTETIDEWTPGMPGGRDQFEVSLSTFDLDKITITNEDEKGERRVVALDPEVKKQIREELQGKYEKMIQKHMAKNQQELLVEKRASAKRIAELTRQLKRIKMFGEMGINSINYDVAVAKEQQQEEELNAKRALEEGGAGKFFQSNLSHHPLIQQAGRLHDRENTLYKHQNFIQELDSQMEETQQIRIDLIMKSARPEVTSQESRDITQEFKIQPRANGTEVARGGVNAIDVSNMRRNGHLRNVLTGKNKKVLQNTVGVNDQKIDPELGEIFELKKPNTQYNMANNEISLDEATKGGDYRYPPKPKLVNYSSQQRAKTLNQKAFGEKGNLAKRPMLANKGMFNVPLDESFGLSSLVDDNLVDALQLPDELHRFRFLHTYQREGRAEERQLKQQAQDKKKLYMSNRANQTADGPQLAALFDHARPAEPQLSEIEEDRSNIELTERPSRPPTKRDEEDE